MAAITKDGSLYIWQYNPGKLPHLADVTPVKVMEDVVAVSAGNYYTAAITTDGSLYTWTYDKSGQSSDEIIPAKVMENVVAVSSAYGTDTK